MTYGQQPGQPYDGRNQNQGGYGNQPQYQQPQYGQYQQNAYQQPQQPQFQQPQYAYAGGTGMGAATATMDGTAIYANDTIQAAQNASITRAYGEMAIGLAVTAVVAFLSDRLGLLYSFLVATGRLGMWGLVIAQVAIAVFLGVRVLKMNPGVARACFYGYAALMGFTMSSIFTVYPIGNIALVFALTAGFFLALSMIGLTMKRSLLKAGPVFMVALIFLIIAEVVMMLLHVSGMTMIISAIGLIIFAGLTMYDAQDARALFAQYGNDTVMLKRISILCALNLYLDFVNIFMYLLQLFGSRD